MIMCMARNPGFFARSALFYDVQKNTIGRLENGANQIASALERELGRDKFNEALGGGRDIALRGVEIVLNPQSKGADIDRIGRDISEIFLTFAPSDARKKSLNNF